VSYDPLSHSRHNAGDSSTKVGHEIKDGKRHRRSWTSCRSGCAAQRAASATSHEV